ncbi:MAG: lycopene cyclase domain-containing protein [Bacteroidota bacterium]
MTYLGFHLVFTLPVIAALWAFRPRDGSAWWPLGVLVAIAFTYTTPWDNYLVAQGVWTYPENRVLATIGYVPVEEYAFFVIQTLLTGLLFRRLRASLAPRVPDPASRRVRIPGVLFFGAVSVAGLVLTLGGGHGLYLGLILVWAGPVLAFMWAVGGEMIWARRRLIAWAVAIPTVYLWVADRIAIGLDIWHLTESTRTGIEIVGLPLEEALFFFVTNLMIVKGLALCEPSRASVLPAMRREAARLAAVRRSANRDLTPRPAPSREPVRPPSLVEA